MKIILTLRVHRAKKFENHWFNVSFIIQNNSMISAYLADSQLELTATKSKLFLNSFLRLTQQLQLNTQHVGKLIQDARPVIPKVCSAEHRWSA